MVGLDPGKCNVTMIMDSEGISLRYPAKQRLFESKVFRYREILKREKDAAGVTEKEAKLLKHTNDREKFLRPKEI